jgi:hypothetical protein
MSKGSRPRPFSIGQEEFGSRMDSIFGKKEPKEPYVPPPLPVESKKSTVEWVSVPVDTEQKDK